VSSRRTQGGRCSNFRRRNWGGDVTLLVSSLFAGEWADSSAFTRCRLVAVEWPAGLLPGPAFPAPDEVLVGAIVKPSLGLAPAEVAAVASALLRQVKLAARASPAARRRSRSGASSLYVKARLGSRN